MTDHPIASPQRLADAALAALGGRLDEGDFRVISPADYARIRAALERLKLLESYLD
jgi:hypothetical protein